MAIDAEPIWARMAALGRGWDGYDADPPSPTAVARARRHAIAAESRGLEPSRIAPSVVGGVGVTYRRGGRSAYVEFRNEGGTCVLFSDGVSEPASRPVTDAEAVVSLPDRIRDYLGGV